MSKQIVPVSISALCATSRSNLLAIRRGGGGEGERFTRATVVVTVTTQGCSFPNNKHCLI